MTKIITDNLIPVETLNTRFINQRKSPSINKTVLKNKKDDFILDGWEEVPSKLKKSVRVKKDKKHNDAFEGRVWALCAKLGFNYIKKQSV